MKPALVCVVGPTASGKSDLAVNLAKRFGGEVVSCDSRQVYRGLNIGTGKVEGTWQTKNGRTVFLYRGVPHHVIDFVSPKRQYTAVLFQRDAERAIRNIVSRGKLPILCGGTGHWAEAVAFGQELPDVAPNPQLRKKLEQKTTAQLAALLKKKDAARAQAIDLKNRRRLVRALEIVAATGKPVAKLANTNPYRVLWLGVRLPLSELDARIGRRLAGRLQAGMVAEAKKLHRGGLSWKRMDELGLEYRFLARFLRGELTENEMQQQLTTAIQRYARRQLTWLRRNKDMRWIASEAAAVKAVQAFLKK